MTVGDHRYLRRGLNLGYRRVRPDYPANRPSKQFQQTELPDNFFTILELRCNILTEFLSCEMIQPSSIGDWKSKSHSTFHFNLISYTKKKSEVHFWLQLNRAESGMLEALPGSCSRGHSFSSGIFLSNGNISGCYRKRPVTIMVSNLLCNTAAVLSRNESFIAGVNSRDLLITDSHVLQGWLTKNRTRDRRPRRPRSHFRESLFGEYGIANAAVSAWETMFNTEFLWCE